MKNLSVYKKLKSGPPNGYPKSFFEDLGKSGFVEFTCITCGKYDTICKCPVHPSGKFYLDEICDNCFCEECSCSPTTPELQEEDHQETGKCKYCKKEKNNCHSCVVY